MMLKIRKMLNNKNLLNWLLLIGGFVVFAISGCDRSSHEKNLKKYVAEVAGRPIPALKPIPQVKPYQHYAYPEHTRNPFLPVRNLRQRQFGPDQNRPKQPLEAFPFDSLRMVGTLNENEVVWALISAPDGVVYRVMVGNFMGQNFGKVTEINPKAVKVMETVPAGEAWETRPATMALTQELEQEK